jgi:hypothetical protein
VGSTAAGSLAAFHVGSDSRQGLVGPSIGETWFQVAPVHDEPRERHLPDETPGGSPISDPEVFNEPDKDNCRPPCALTGPLVPQKVAEPDAQRNRRDTSAVAVSRN